MMTARTRAESLVLSLVTFLGVGIVASIILVLYEYRSLVSVREGGYGDGPICGRRVTAPNPPVVDERSGEHLRTMRLNRLLQDHLLAYRPVIFRGGLNSTVLERMQMRFSDESLAEQFNSESSLLVEYNKVENRTGGSMTTDAGTFLRHYREKGWYAATKLSWEKEQNEPIFSERWLPHVVADLLRSGVRLGRNIFPTTSFWWSFGGSKSVIHQDGFTNVHFLLEGKKVFHLADCSFLDDLYFPQFMKPGPDTTTYASEKSPVAFFRPDFAKYPRYKNVKWSSVEVHPGDVLVLPQFMVHYVEAPEDRRTVSLNFFIEDNLADDAALGIEGACPGVIEYLRYVPRALHQIVKDIYFMRPSYSVLFLTLLPDWIMPYTPFAYINELYCRNGFGYAWSEGDGYDDTFFKEPYVYMKDVFKDVDEDRCTLTNIDKIHAYIGACMLLGALLVYVTCEKTKSVPVIVSEGGFRNAL